MTVFGWTFTYKSLNASIFFSEVGINCGDVYGWLTLIIVLSNRVVCPDFCVKTKIVVHNIRSSLRQPALVLVFH